MKKEDFNNDIGAELSLNKDKRKFKILATTAILASIVCWLIISTQYFAHAFAYHQNLGNPIFLHFYIPSKIINWSVEYRFIYPEILKKSLLVGFISSVGPIVFILIVIQARNKNLKLKYLHGSARWANRKDIIKAGLLNKDSKKLSDGVFVGAWHDPKLNKVRYLRHDGPEHVLCVAPTRSGKGVGLVNPTLLTWKHSCFVTDLKGELWALTSGWRSKHAKNKCIRFEPAKKRQCINQETQEFNVARWNPLDEIRSEGSEEYFFNAEKGKIETRICSGEYEIADVQNIATLIVDPDGKGLQDHWAKTAFALITGAILHLKHNLPEHCNLQTLDLLLAGQINTEEIRKNKTKDLKDVKPYPKISNLWIDMKKGLDRDGKPYSASKTVITAGADMYDRPEEEAGSVLSTAKSFLALYRDDIVAENTSTSDFKIKQLMNLENPVSLYVVTQPNDKGRLVPLVRLLVNLVIRLLADNMEFKDGRSVKGYNHRLLLMLDEFPSLGKLDIMQESLAFIAGYGMKAYLITQDMSQLFDKYGKDESISSNCHVSCWYAPLKTDTANILSDKIGTTTVETISESTSSSGMNTNRSRSKQFTGRKLLTADECMQMQAPEKQGDKIVAPGRMVTLVAGFPAIFGIQPLYFQNKLLLERAKVKAPEVTDRIFFNQNDPNNILNKIEEITNADE